jgi:hypothetical protein
VAQVFFSCGLKIPVAEPPVRNQADADVHSTNAVASRVERRIAVRVAW